MWTCELPKFHRQGTPVRPIVFYTGTPLYNFSKCVANILSTYVKEGSQNSKVFSEYVRTLRVESEEVIVSFDVKFLYTNVPIKNANVVIKQFHENDADLHKTTT